MADYLDILLTTDEVAPVDPATSLGGIAASIDAVALAAVVTTPMRGLAVLHVAGACGAGSAEIVALAANQLAFRAPGSTATGAPVSVAADTTVVLESADDPAAWVRVKRVGSTTLQGACAIELAEALHNAFGGDDVAVPGASTTRTVRAVMLAADGGNLTDMAIYLPTYGPPSAASGGALAASGAGTLTVADASDWPADTHCVRIETAGGALREIVGGSLAGDVFTVPAAGRGLCGTSAAAGATDDVCVPVPPLEVAIETPSGSPPAIQEVVSETAMPTGLTWSTAIDAADGPSVASLTDGSQVGVWIRRTTFAGQSPSPLIEAGILLAYTSDGDELVQTLAGMYRVSQDLSAQRYQVFAASGEGVAVDMTSTPIATAAARPITVTGLAYDTVHNLVAVEVSDHGVATAFASGTIRLDASGDELLPPPATPYDVAVYPRASVAPDSYAGCAVQAVYYTELDGDDPATHWIITAENGLGDDVATAVAVDTGGAAVLATEIAHADWAAGQTVTVTVALSRSSNPLDTSAQGGAVSKSFTVSTAAPAATEFAGLFIGGRLSE